MTNHPGRKQPAWVADAQAVAAERIEATRWPQGDGAHVLTRAELQQALTDAMVWAYGRGLRAKVMQERQPGRAEDPRTTRGVDLIRGGQALRAVAEQLGLAPSTLVRACQRAGVSIPRGRRPSR